MQRLSLGWWWRCVMVWKRLQFDERTELRRRLTAGESLSVIASALGRQTSTISREVSRNGGVLAYRPWKAQLRANRLARRPKAFKLERHRKLARWVSEKLELRWSPEQIAGRLRRDHPHDPRWWVSAETIYQSLYVQARGGLNEELTRYLRTRRPKRRASQANRGHGQLNDMVMISERPPEADDRRVPGHWEGDLLQGGRNSQIATLVERTSRYLIPVALPDGRTAPLGFATLGLLARLLGLDFYIIDNIELRRDFNYLLRLCKRGRYDLLVLDTQSRVLAMEKENDNSEANFLAGLLRRIANEAGCSILLIHHSTKGDEGKAVYRGRGASAIAGAVDVVVNLDALGDDTLRLSVVKHRIQGSNPKLLLRKSGEDRFEPCPDQGGGDEPGFALYKAQDAAVALLSESLTPMRTGEIIEAIQMDIDVEKRTIERALGRLAQSGKITKLKKGYYECRRN